MNRFSDFRRLDAIFRSANPTIMLYPLPERMVSIWQDQLEEAFIRERAGALERYLDHMLRQLPQLMYHPDLLLFFGLDPMNAVPLHETE